MDRPFKPIVFSDHSQTQMKERGATREEVIEAIKYGEKISAKHKRQAYRKNFQFDSKWGNKSYRIKQVMPITAEEENQIVVITVYAFYF